jgi:hypothetical protein
MNPLNGSGLGQYCTRDEPGRRTTAQPVPATHRGNVGGHVRAEAPRGEVRLVQPERVDDGRDVLRPQLALVRRRVVRVAAAPEPALVVADLAGRRQPCAATLSTRLTRYRARFRSSRSKRSSYTPESLAMPWVKMTERASARAGAVAVGVRAMWPALVALSLCPYFRAVRGSQLGRRWGRDAARGRQGGASASNGRDEGDKVSESHPHAERWGWGVSHS